MPIIRLLLAFLLVAPASALAASPLTSDEVDRFMTAVETLAEDEGPFEDLDIDVDLDISSPGEALDLLIDRDGEIVLFSRIVEGIEDDPELRGTFREVIRENGFRNSRQFADVGNRLILAIIRLDMDDDDLAEMQRLDELTGLEKAFIPGPIEKVLARVALLGEALEDVPASDVRLAEDAERRLDAIN
ncbi:hypothetical protein HK107_14835 [Parvularcula sp. ZS-1/3]|uniref:Uncharacterized protein n=1 Tax=Parvularcula mediterranea TaxID=2732508 RepID=A0A7Y3RP63_9PROT|nr:hypothetical protein [Parvularcula mediterranea]NNU17605.1 hypothetical protein [Parvularcula mediterranea]